VPARIKWRYGAQYLALVTALAVLAFDAHERLPLAIT